ncbi:hypothetical protein [Limnohabitans sp. Jir72]|uniref:hypothetical protein n=1 Tax=Limnohabitans sp. Jir72 TaxID=1977909 RepID=UPI000D3D91D7|nr:hypothetical protein [Limnohabitans sp. Jir72]PUE35771.1 hypothetical protein B9Z52_00905 [Limnohabitans sp. Jir72]
MKISEVVGDGLQSFVAVVRCAVDGMGSVTIRVQIRCDGLIQARYLLTRLYGRGNVQSVHQTVLEQSIKPIEPSTSVIRPIKPKSGIIKSIKPMTPKQGMKKSMADAKKAVKKKERKTKAINRVRVAQNHLADINREP